MDAAEQQLQTLLELETRHDELLDRLSELDQRVCETLARYQTPRGSQPAASVIGAQRVDDVASTIPNGPREETSPPCVGSMAPP